MFRPARLSRHFQAPAGRLLGGGDLDRDDIEAAGVSEHREQFRDIAHRVADRAGFPQDPRHFRRGIAARRRKAHGQSEQQRQLGRGALGASRLPPQQFDRRLQMPHRLHVRGSRRGALPGRRPEADGLVRGAALGQMMRHELGLPLLQLRKAVAQHGRNLPVQRLALALQQRFVSGVANERVLEQIFALRRHAQAFNQARTRQFAQSAGSTRRPANSQPRRGGRSRSAGQWSRRHWRFAAPGPAGRAAPRANRAGWPE